MKSCSSRRLWLSHDSCWQQPAEHVFTYRL
jgi:hypothetical protein